MAINKITKNLNLDLSNVPVNQRSAAKEDVGNFVKEEILRSLSTGNSPVAGEQFKKLSKQYADEFKGGNQTPNLELEGDLLDALKFEEKASGIEIGIFPGKEVPKADGHNNFSGDSKLPKRRFIPEENQTFKKKIMNGVNAIIREYETEPGGIEPTFRSIFDVEQSETRTDIQVSDLFSDDFFTDFLRDRGLV